MTRAHWAVALTVLVPALVGLAGPRLWVQPPQEQQRTFVTHKVGLGDIEQTIAATGFLQPHVYADVCTPVSGQLQKLHVNYGDRVKAGDLLAEIDSTFYQAKVGSDEAMLLNLRAQLDEKGAQRTLAEQQFRRQKQLLAVHATSQDAFDSSEATLKASSAQIAALHAQIQQTQSVLGADRASLDDTKIYAPISGTVMSISARQGQSLSASQASPVILRIADPDTMTVWTQVSEADIYKLKVGMPIYFTTVGDPERRRYGSLRQVLPNPEVRNNVVLYNALFDVPNPDHDLLPQMSAQVFFILGQAKGVPIVPLAALRPVGGGPGDQANASTQHFTVRVLDRGHVSDRPVVVGVMSRLAAEVRTGLKPGEEVVLDNPNSYGGVPGPGTRPTRL